MIIDGEVITVKKALVLFSGGVDSTTCLAMAVDRYGSENVIALSVSYGQKHTKELKASKDGYPLYRKLGFEKSSSSFTPMKLIL